MALSVSWKLTLSQLDVRYAQVTYVDAADTILAQATTDHANAGNPHSITKTVVGLSAVTDDAQLKESNLTQTITASATAIPSAQAVITYVANEVLDPIVAALIFGGE